MVELSTTQQQALDHARALANAGVPIFCARPDPEGRTKSGRQTGFMLPRAWETTKPNARYVDAWQPGMALCAVMGRVLDLIDFDPQNAEDGVIDKLKAVGVPFTYGHVETPSGGWHAYIKTMGVASHDAILPGIDIKAGYQGEGHGFSFLPPTLRPSKVTGEPREYTWYAAPDLSFLDSDEGEPAFIEFAKGQRKPTTSEFVEPTSSGIDVSGTISIGQRDNELTRYAARLRGLGITFEESKRLLVARWRDCEQPESNRYEWQDALGKLESAWRNIEPSGRGEPEQAPGDDLDRYFLTVEQLDELPQPGSLIKGVLDKSTLFAISGRDRVFKSFFGFGQLASLATGKPWLGHEVERTKVLYVVGEGAYGLAARRDAWQIAWDCKIPADMFHVRRLPVNLFKRGPDLAHLAQWIEREQYSVVLFDTLQRMSSGADMNSARDAGLIVDAMSALRDIKPELAIGMVAHTGKTDDDVRGSSAFEDDLDIVWQLKRDEDDQIVTATLVKRKDGPEGATLEIEPRFVEGSGSLVLQHARRLINPDKMPAHALQIMEHLCGYSIPDDGEGKTRLSEALGIHYNSVNKPLDWLISKGFVEKRGSRNRPVFKITEKGSHTLDSDASDPVTRGDAR